MNDYLIRGVAMDGQVRVIAAKTTALVDELRVRQKTLPTATAALGRAATAGAMIGAMLKDEQKVTIQIKGNGPIGQIVVDANASGEVRGYADRPEVHLPANAFGKLDVAGAVGTEGYLYVIKDLGLKEPYRGSVPLVSGELGEDFTSYFLHSEQTPSAVALGVLVDVDGSVKAAGGFILQLLPGVPEDEVAKLEARIQQLEPVSALIDKGLAPEDIASRLIGPVNLLERTDLQFRCRCSADRVEQTLISLGKEEISSIIAEEGQAEIVCHFCNEVYRFSGEQLNELLRKISG